VYLSSEQDGTLVVCFPCGWPGPASSPQSGSSGQRWQLWLALMQRNERGGGEVGVVGRLCIDEKIRKLGCCPGPLSKRLSSARRVAERHPYGHTSPSCSFSTANGGTKGAFAPGLLFSPTLLASSESRPGPWTTKTSLDGIGPPGG
jgi:hypothetical protein